MSARFAIAVVLASLIAGCGITRSRVKNLRDHEAPNIQFDTPVSTTLKALNAIPSHCGPAHDHRVHSEEFRVYEVVGRITRIKRERDHDIHIVLQDPEYPEAHLVAESGDPNIPGNTASPYREKLEHARKMLEELQKQSGARELEDLVGMTVRVTGVGFFDLNHFQFGRSRSCIELHPILTIAAVPEPTI